MPRGRPRKYAIEEERQQVVEQSRQKYKDK